MTRDVERTLIVFAKVPRPGRVKTRLAAAIGDVEAASLYRVMGRRVLDGVRGGDYRIVVYIDPANELAAAREWLGAAGAGFRPQEGDDLGERLAHAFRREYRRAPQVCAIGTDAPAVDRRVVERAFAELSAHDLVLGPALDGGYYLIGGTGYWPDLFRDVPWSTEEVMTTTLARAHAPEAVHSHARAPAGHRHRQGSGAGRCAPMVTISHAPAPAIRTVASGPG